MVFGKVTIDAVNRAAETLDGIAGKSINVAKVLHALGEEPVAVGFIGGDRGEELKRTIETRGIETGFISVTERTRQCITVIDKSTVTQTELVEESKRVSPDAYDALLNLIRTHAKGCRAIVMSGTLTPQGPTDFYLQCCQIAYENNALAVVDAHGPALLRSLEARPDLVKPNRAELGAMLGRDLVDEAETLKAMKELIEQGAKNVVITAGKSPALALEGKRPWRISSPRIETINPIGSGDAFTAAVVWRLLLGDDLGQACRWGAASGAANALNLMAGEVKREDVERLLEDVKVEEMKA